MSLIDKILGHYGYIKRPIFKTIDRGGLEEAINSKIRDENETRKKQAVEDMAVFWDGALGPGSTALPLNDSAIIRHWTNEEGELEAERDGAILALKRERVTTDPFLWADLRAANYQFPYFYKGSRTLRQR
jgi:hypothetical protein